MIYSNLFCCTPLNRYTASEVSPKSEKVIYIIIALYKA